MLINKYIAFAISFLLAGINGAAWSGVGVDAGTAAAISTFVMFALSALHLSAPGPNQVIVKTGNPIFPHT